MSLVNDYDVIHAVVFETDDSRLWDFYERYSNDYNVLRHLVANSFVSDDLLKEIFVNHVYVRSTIFDRDYISEDLFAFMSENGDADTIWELLAREDCPEMVYDVAVNFSNVDVQYRLAEDGRTPEHVLEQLVESVSNSRVVGCLSCNENVTTKMLDHFLCISDEKILKYLFISDKFSFALLKHLFEVFVVDSFNTYGSMLTLFEAIIFHPDSSDEWFNKILSVCESKFMRRRMLNKMVTVPGSCYYNCPDDWLEEISVNGFVN